ncbi:adrenodoxin [Gasterosteus aculeatus]|uniref:2Fe-2S ferredoxin-type domain-containing protein n=1 Tax=Gasterosteus aculeatus aculeatus TaxID=481459 RepID=G3PMB6_GASAC|nr:adrenodoxin-like [Gasterosteus aculeatus aculeatus]
MAFVTALRRLPLAGLRERSWRTAAVVTSGARLAGRRSFTGGTQPLRSNNKVTVNFINRDGEKISVKGSPGDSLLDIVINEDLDFDGFGACEGTLACSTCHLIFDEETYKSLGPVTDEEMDMLDLAYGLTDTSRLGCQICLTKSLEGVVARVPESVADIRQSQDGSS